MAFGRSLILMIAVLCPAIAYAGQIYGSIIFHGAALANAAVEINCQGAMSSGATAADGAYRINVPQQGQCALTLPAHAGRPTATIFSSPNPSLYNFELVQLPNGYYELRRR
jgi:hypothetical protein